MELGYGILNTAGKLKFAFSPRTSCWSPPALLRMLYPLPLTLPTHTHLFTLTVFPLSQIHVDTAMNLMSLVLFSPSQAFRFECEVFDKSRFSLPGFGIWFFYGELFYMVTAASWLVECRTTIPDLAMIFSCGVERCDCVGRNGVRPLKWRRITSLLKFCCSLGK